MSQSAEFDEIESLWIELEEIGRSRRSSFRSCVSSFSSVTPVDSEQFNDINEDEYELQYAAVQKLPTFERITTALFDEKDVTGKRLVNVTKLGAEERRMFIEKLIKHIENDNLQLLQKIRKRIDKVGVQLPSVEVRYKNLSVEAECEVVHGKPLPTLWNATKSMFSGFTSLLGSKQEAKLRIIKDVSGVIKPGRMTLLLGPPGCGKTTFLSALSGKLSHSLKVSGDISYNGYRLEEFVPQKTSAYISQYDLHIPEITVRETLDFSARCQGIGDRAEIMIEVSKREKQAGIVPDPDIDAYMKAISVKGLKSTLQTDYILKILGLDICAETMVGDAMRRGISGGQKKRLTTGELIVGPTKALFMDEISNGLDSSTTFQIISCLKHLVHITDATALISLLQPAPETFDLFDDVIMMAEGKIVYHGPCSYICKFFEDSGFQCPERKGVADFLQEVISRKDQAQYWHHEDQPYSYISTDQFIKKFKECHLGRKLDEELTKPFIKSENHQSALSFEKYSLTTWEMLKACTRREYLLMKRNSFIYVFKSTQLLIIASITMTVFLHSQMANDLISANYYLGALFYSLVVILVDGFPEVNMTVSRIAVFYKQRELCFYPAWAYAIPATILKLPLSCLEAFVWTSLTYYVIGYSPQVERLSIYIVLVAAYMPSWLEWGFWASPLTYGEIGITVNEFLAPRWQKKMSGNTTVGHQTLESRGLNFDDSFYWMSVCALIGFTVLFNVVFLLALTFLKPPGRSRAIISYEKYSHLQEEKDGIGGLDEDKKTNDAPLKNVTGSKSGRMVLPFKPLRLTFQDVQYYVDVPMEFVNEVFETIELDGIKDSLVGVPGISGLSTEQRKRLTIAVELVSNPSIIFMDEPTSGLDARAAAIVMRAVKNVVETGRTVVCTIHQPSIDIFEAFDDVKLQLPSCIISENGYHNSNAYLISLQLILMKAGGRIIYSGLLGQHSSRVIEYFENICGVPKIKDNYNPATWMLEVTSKSVESELGVDFAEIYNESTLYQENKEQVKRLSSPSPNSNDLHFPTRFPQNGWEQFKACLWKQHLSYWRSPSYNLIRIIFIAALSVLYGILFWQQGTKLNNQQDLFNVLGSMYSAILFFGIYNCSTVLPFVATERNVLYRERFAGMYSSWAYSFAQVLIEVPYLFTEAVIYVIITYPTIGYYWSAYKIFWSFYGMFCNLLYFSYLGMLVVSLTPNVQMAAIVTSSSYTMLNLFSGFIIPRPHIPKWWLWLYYICPTSWALNGMLTSQYGDIKKEISVFGETKTVATFLEDYFGFHHNFLGVVAVVLIVFPIVFASLFAYFIGKLNFQKR
ncbi:hypothetical protein LWI29_001896 [Acer saccharum]|uniref:ABC transporter domain-containing protein n=1 Tax=Acer saccharum TaxID=4024 RepID=A0AA39W1P1_ACESA|nr:hypothetical protein LWI29_001896 [Acer saccharum]